MDLVLSDGFVLLENQKIYKTDDIACAVLEEMAKQLLLKFSNKCKIISMDKGAQENKLVVAPQARILYADAEGRKIAEAFNQAITKAI
jgi:urocanate hydratase